MLQSDIQDGAPITTDALGGLDYVRLVDDGYDCEKCGKPVARRRSEDVWSIRTSRGWME